MKQPLTDAQADVHMEEWALIAAEVGFEALSAAVREVMRNDTEWFPSVKAIRERAGLKKEHRLAVEAEEAWESVQRYLRKWGVDGLPSRSGGKSHYPPSLPPPIDYAVRLVGGLWAINQVNANALPFMRKAFAEAYRLAPLADTLRPQIVGGKFLELAAAKEMK